MSSKLRHPQLVDTRSIPIITTSGKANGDIDSDVHW